MALTEINEGIEIDSQEKCTECFSVSVHRCLEGKLRCARHCICGISPKSRCPSCNKLDTLDDFKTFGTMHKFCSRECKVAFYAYEEKAASIVEFHEVLKPPANILSIYESEIGVVNNMTIAQIDERISFLSLHRLADAARMVQARRVRAEKIKALSAEELVNYGQEDLIKRTNPEKKKVREKSRTMEEKLREGLLKMGLGNDAVETMMRKARKEQEE